MNALPKGIRFLIVVAVVMSVGLSAAWAMLDGPQGQFVADCRPGHTNSDDAIVYPRKPGFSHRHQYFGARSTDAFSRAAHLRQQESTCDRSEDTSAYWVPTLEVGGTEVKPVGAAIYYTSAGKRRDLVNPFPPGLRMIAGNAGARKPQPKRKATWMCFAPPAASPRTDNVVGWTLFVAAFRRIQTNHPHCGQPGGVLGAQIEFPDCWDGRRIDSHNHRDHMRYSRHEEWDLQPTCPESHPVSVPRIRLEIVYRSSGSSKPGEVELSSGGSHSLHADFINSWDQSALSRLVRRCINLALC